MTQHTPITDEELAAVRAAMELPVQLPFNKAMLARILARLDKAERKLRDDDMLAALKAACASVEKEANWDKPPYSVWYYKSKEIIARAESSQ